MMKLCLNLSDITIFPLSTKVNAIAFLEAWNYFLLIIALPNFSVFSFIFMLYTKLMLLFFYLKHNKFFDIALVFHLNQYLRGICLFDISYSFSFSDKFLYVFLASSLKTSLFVKQYLAGFFYLLYYDTYLLHFSICFFY